MSTRRANGSDNLQGADNQQERPANAGILRDYTLGSSTRRDEIVRSAWRHAEVVRNALLHQHAGNACWCNTINGPKVSGIVALVKFGYMLENPCIPRYSFGEPTSDSVSEPGSDNPTDAENQQERLITIGWITGFVDGEGCFSIQLWRQPHRASRRGYKTGTTASHAMT